MTIRSPCPDFLIIGAMKAGTTTLYRDLETHPNVFLPQEKEPETLVRFADDGEAIRRDYQSLFRSAQANDLKGEASTAYTKRPLHEGAAEQALRICGPDLKIIYLMRDPVSRMVSHYRHAYGLHETDLGMHEAFAQDSQYYDFSRYAYQLEPWQKRFAPENFLYIIFEDYVSDRQATLETVCAFLGLDAATLPALEEDKAFNKSEGKPVALGIIGRIVSSPLYQRGMKRVIPRAVRDRVMAAILPKARKAQGTLSEAEHLALTKRFAAEPQPPMPSSDHPSTATPPPRELG